MITLLKKAKQSALQTLMKKASLAVIASIIAFSFSGGVPTQACTVPDVTNGITYTWVWVSQNNDSIQGVSANLDSYNPNPIFGNTSGLTCFWVMLADRNAPGSASYAQVGWLKQGSDSTEKVYCEFADNQSNWWRYWWDPSGWYWSGDPSTGQTPSSSNLYSVTYWAGEFSMVFANSAAKFATNLGWVPNTLDVASETHKF